MLNVQDRSHNLGTVGPKMSVVLKLRNPAVEWVPWIPRKKNQIDITSEFSALLLDLSLQDYLQNPEEKGIWS